MKHFPVTVMSTNRPVEIIPKEKRHLMQGNQGKTIVCYLFKEFSLMQALNFSRIQIN